MSNEESQARLLGELGERVIEIFRVLQPEVTVQRAGLIAVTRSESEIMRYLMAEPGATVTQMARVFGHHKSNTSTRVATLVEKGLARKEAGGADGREVRIYPTEQAVRNLESYREIWAERLAPAIEGDAERIRVAVEVLRGLSERLAFDRSPDHVTSESKGS